MIFVWFVCWSALRTPSSELRLFVWFVCFVVYNSAFRTPNSELGQGGFWHLLADKWGNEERRNIGASR